MRAFHKVGICPFATKPEQVRRSIKMLDLEISRYITNLEATLSTTLGSTGERTKWCGSEFVEFRDVLEASTRKELTRATETEFFLQPLPKDLNKHFENVLKNR